MPVMLTCLLVLAAVTWAVDEEIPGYVWAKPTSTAAANKAEPEEPLKVDDHGSDTCRYVVAELDLVGTSSVQSPARRGRAGVRGSRGAAATPERPPVMVGAREADVGDPLHFRRNRGGAVTLVGGTQWAPPFGSELLAGCAAMTTQPDQAGSVTLPATIGPAATVKTSRPFDDLVQRFQRDCAALGVSDRVTLRVRAALRRRFRLQRWKRRVLLGLLIGFFAMALGLFGIVVQAFRLENHPLGYEKWLMAHEGNPWALSVMIFLIACEIWCCIFIVLQAFGEYLLSPRETGSQFSRIVAARRYALVSQCVEAIDACSEVRRGGQQRPANFRKLSKCLKTVRRGVLGAHGSRGTVAWRSHRRKPLKLHERRVSAALMELETKLDHAPNEAVREIAEALLTIADRYCEARIGELLDDQQLTDVPPQRNWEALRYLTAFVLAGGGITGLETAGVVPESAQVYVYGTVWGAACVIAFGRNFRRALDVLSTITGAP
ncbi:hypothetical protein ACFY0A_39755 [Streptomyces sp. NPDC001698]|uniref:hypothetical protein n=1 Tax=Streptomyces sp. NPDC001698 TaxID=3364601 RepID=UPI00368D3F23